MLFMVIERFRDRDAKAVYRRFRDRGRGAPEGLSYVDSWIEANFDRCFQVMECDDARLLQQWVAFWGDLVEFEIVPVVASADTRATIEPLFGGRPRRSVDLGGPSPRSRPNHAGADECQTGIDACGSGAGNRGHAREPAARRG